MQIRPFNKQKIPKPQFENIPEGFARTVIEIGPGVGFHPINYCKRNPDALVIAIEKTTEKFNKFKRRAINHPHLNNLVPVHSNAVWWITHNIKPNTIDEFFILYPNPYPKDPQKRFFRMPFMSHLIETLKSKGRITLATNEKFYFDEALLYNEKIWNLTVIENKIINENNQPRTHFEKKYLKDKQICFNLIFEK